MASHAVSIRAIRRVLAEAHPRDTALLLILMILSRLTEGIGIFLLVPLVGSLAGDSSGNGLGPMLAKVPDLFGLSTSTGVLLALVVALIAARAILVMAQQSLSARYQYEIVDRMRARLFAGLLRSEWRWFVERRASDFANILTGGIMRISAGIAQLIALVTAIATLAAYTAAALLLSWQITILFGFLGTAAFLLFAKQRQRATELGLQVGQSNRSLQAIFQEALSAVRIIKLTRSEDRIGQQFNDSMDRLREGQNAYVRSMGIGEAITQTGGAALLALMLYAGVHWFALPLAILLTMALIFVRLLPIFATCQQSYHGWLHCSAAFDEYDAALAEATTAAEPHGVKVAPISLRTEIRLEHVAFAHGNSTQPVFSALSCTIPALKTTVISGQSGAGKSTIADLVCGLIEPCSGQVLIDGKQLSGDVRAAWRHSVAYVQQDSWLSNDSIRANLHWARPEASEAEIRSALEAASADFVYQLPQGLDSIVGDSGQKLSGGERQRIALARALLTQPQLLILDEATSALDAENEAAIHTALGRLRGSITMLVIGHRGSLLNLADEHLVLADGQIEKRAPQLEPA